MIWQNAHWEEQIKSLQVKKSDPKRDFKICFYPYMNNLSILQSTYFKADVKEFEKYG